MVAAKPKMAIEEFDALLDTHGSDVDRWPEIERQLAKQLLKMSDVAKTRLHDQQDIACLLSSRSAPKAPSGLVDKIMQKARQTP